MKTFRPFVITSPGAMRALKARASLAGLPLQEYLGLLLIAAAEADPIEVPQRRATDTGKSIRPSYPTAA